MSIKSELTIFTILSIVNAVLALFFLFAFIATWKPFNLTLTAVNSLGTLLSFSAAYSSYQELKHEREMDYFSREQ